MAMAATTSSLPPRFGALPMMHIANPSDSHVRFRRSRGKRVTWASNDHLCQVRMFLAEDAPFLAGIAQEQLQGKTTSSMHSAEDLPPGFGGGGFGVGSSFGIAGVAGVAVSSCMKVDTDSLIASVSAAIPWRCPAKFELDPQWLVEAGEASSEVETQKQRESTTLEAVYPRSSAIPTTPAEPDDQGFFVDDRQVPLIPVVAPDEDSDGEDPSAQGGLTSVSAPVSVGYNQTVVNEPMLGNKPPMMLSPTPTTYMNGSSSLPGGVNNNNNNSKGIDTSLLLQLLANPSLVETLSGLRNKSMVNTPNGNAANHLLVPPRNQSVTGLSSSSVQPAVVRNLTSLTPLTTSSATQSVSPPAPVPAPSVGFPAPPVAPVSWQQQQSVPPGFQHQYMNVNVSLNGNSQHQQHHQQQQQQHQQQQQGSRNGEQYFKELIMQHGRGGVGGGNGQQVQQHQQQQVGGGNGYVSNGVPPGFGLIAETKGGKPSSKPRKVCAYYNTAKGCRNGSKCPFLHDGKRNGAELMNHNTAQQNKRMRS